MVSAYRLIFDASVYYAVSGLLLQSWVHKQPSALGFGLLCAALLLYVMIGMLPRLAKVNVWVLLLPVVAVIAERDVAAFLHSLPIWVYCVATLLANRADITYKDFQDRITRSVVFIVVVTIVVLFGRPDNRVYLENVAGYFISMVVCAIVCLRSITDPAGSLRHLAVVLLFALGCVVLNYFNIPRLILSFVRDYVIGGIAALILLLIDGILGIVIDKQSVDGAKSSTQPKSASAESIRANWNMGKYELSEKLIFTSKLITYIIIGAFCGFLLYKLVRYIVKTGRKQRVVQEETKWQEETARIRESSGNSGRRQKRRKPKDYRLQVRYYYWRYLRECGKRGIVIPKNWTGEELADVSAEVFNAEDLLAMQELYNPARYYDNAVISVEQARQASKLWLNLKRNKIR